MSNVSVIRRNIKAVLSAPTETTAVWRAFVGITLRPKGRRKEMKPASFCPWFPASLWYSQMSDPNGRQVVKDKHDYQSPGHSTHAHSKECWLRDSDIYHLPSASFFRQESKQCILKRLYFLSQKIINRINYLLHHQQYLPAGTQTDIKQSLLRVLCFMLQVKGSHVEI